MKKSILFLLLVLPISAIFPQKSLLSEFKTWGEVYFRFPLQDKAQVNKLTRIISIDNVTRDSVYAYANEKEFNVFLGNGLKYELLPHPGDVPDVKMYSDAKSTMQWDSYPTYDAYVAMMNNFQNNYPNLCKIYETGTTVKGRKILFAKITANVSASQPGGKPEFMYTSSMHGDETTGYILMLRLIDSLLSTYGANDRITNLLNNVQIWINPLANPDGTYHSGNSSVSGAVRENGNSVDLNRNFPDVVEGEHPDGEVWQPETVAMMNLLQAHRFVLSANFHGGAEVVNYPWDHKPQLHPDDAWFEPISRAFADTVHKYSPSTYLSDLTNGVTNGYAWYVVYGGRQDYMTWFMHGREVTIELCHTKLTPAAQLPAYWTYLKASLLNYIENTYYGIRGTVTDISGAPLKATITIQGHDADNSEVMSDSVTGFYVRMLAPGTYTVVVSADSCITQTFNSVKVAKGAAVPLNIQLLPTYLCKNIDLATGWNLVTVPALASDMTPVTIFGKATSPVYGFDTVYKTASILKPGKAYWVQYASNASVQVCGTPQSGAIPLVPGWNMIGVNSSEVNVSGITTTPANIITSPFYSFSTVYTTATTLQPGVGYWVRASQAGIINLP